ncbi:MAG: hypothetical protein JXJ17_14410 [Anaerolineae bacterium]|nr:hypothetical protein [Anaerolineae bacterium]
MAIFIAGMLLWSIVTMVSSAWSGYLVWTDPPRLVRFQNRFTPKPFRHNPEKVSILTLVSYKIASVVFFLFGLLIFVPIAYVLTCELLWFVRSTLSLL